MAGLWGRGENVCGPVSGERAVSASKGGKILP